jgi:hypothetical protein
MSNFRLLEVPQRFIEETVSRDFRPSFFSLNCTPGAPDSWAKTVLHIDSNSQSHSIKFDDENRLRAMPHSGESQIKLFF